MSYVDKIYFVLDGVVLLKGYSVYFMYYKILFEKLDVIIYVFCVGIYKLVIEFFVCDDMFDVVCEFVFCWFI